jgi:hypothetical protein
MSVIQNTQGPVYMHKKKSNSICSHVVRESVAVGEIVAVHISLANHPTGIVTMIIPRRFDL